MQKEAVMKCIKIPFIDGNQPNLEAKEKRDFTILVKANVLRAKVKAKEEFNWAWSTLSQSEKVKVGC